MCLCSLLIQCIVRISLVVFNPSLVISVASYKHPVKIRTFSFTLTTNSLLVGNTQPPCIPH